MFEFEYGKKQCSRCSGSGTVRFLLFFRRICPDCYGIGTIDGLQFKPKQDVVSKVPTLIRVPADKPQALHVSELSTESQNILRKKPELLHVLTTENRLALRRKYPKLAKPPKPPLEWRLGGRVSQDNIKPLQTKQYAVAPKNKQFQEFMDRMREQQRAFINHMNEQSQQRFKDFAHQSVEWHQKWAQEQHQKWVNQQFHDFAHKMR